jgi:hypothetical protein
MCGLDKYELERTSKHSKFLTHALVQYIYIHVTEINTYEHIRIYHKSTKTPIHAQITIWLFFRKRKTEHAA